MQYSIYQDVTNYCFRLWKTPHGGARLRNVSGLVVSTVALFQRLQHQKSPVQRLELGDLPLPPLYLLTISHTTYSFLMVVS